MGITLIRDKGGVIYFVQPGEIQKVKIGFTFGQIRQRIKALQTGSCEILKLIGIIPEADEFVEMAIHEKFKEFRLHGEWFNLTPPILEFLKEKGKFPAINWRGDWIGDFDSMEEAETARLNALHEQLQLNSAVK